MSEENPLFTEPPANYTGHNKWKNWHNYKVEVGGGYDSHLLNEIERKRNNIEATIVVCTGRAGTGKSYFVLRLCQILDSKFSIEQVPFGIDELLNVLSSESKIKMGQCVVIDESQFALSSRTWNETMQRSLIRQLEAIRSKGLVIFIVCLSENTLDILARSYIITHKIHLNKRGHAKVYSYNLSAFSKSPYPKTISSDCSMLMPDAEICEAQSCFRCPYSGLRNRLWQSRAKWIDKHEVICQTLRAKYERKKKAYLESQVDETTAKREDNKQPIVKKLEIQDIVNIMKAHSDKLKRTSQNNVDELSAQVLIKGLHSDISDYNILKALRILSLDKPFVGTLTRK